MAPASAPAKSAAALQPAPDWVKRSNELAQPLLKAQAEEIEAVRRLSHDLLLISVMTQRPQVTLPVAQTGGLPLGISFLGPRGSDRLLVELAAAFMQGDRNEQ